jgi:hypothetical protein
MPYFISSFSVLGNESLKPLYAINSAIKEMINDTQEINNGAVTQKK